MHVGESSKITCGRQGALDERPYPPFCRNSSSNFRTSRTSRSSLRIWTSFLAVLSALTNADAVTYVTQGSDSCHCQARRARRTLITVSRGTQSKLHGTDSHWRLQNRPPRKGVYKDAGSPRSRNY